MPNKLLIVDDFPVFREGLKALLTNVASLEVIGETKNGRTAVIKAHDLKPDLILMNLTMPPIHSVEAIRRIKQNDPDIKIIVLAEQKSQDYLNVAIAAGASGYILKEDTTTSLFCAIECVLNGYNYLGPGDSRQEVSGSQDKRREYQQLTTFEA